MCSIDDALLLLLFWPVFCCRMRFMLWAGTLHIQGPKSQQLCVRGHVCVRVCVFIATGRPVPPSWAPRQPTHLLPQYARTCGAGLELAVPPFQCTHLPMEQQCTSHKDHSPQPPTQYNRSQ